MKKTALSLIAAAMLGLSGVAAQAAQVFQVNEDRVPGANAEIVTADLLNGGYTEKLTINDDFSFSTQAWGTFNSFRLAGADVDSQLGSRILGAAEGIPQLYRMYFTFDSTGQYNPLDGSFTGANGSFKLFIDADRNTDLTLGADGTVPVTIGGAVGDDFQIAFANNLTFAFGRPDSLAGAFDLFWDDFTRTPEGEEYFISPTNFYLRVNVDGDFNSFAPDLSTYVIGGGAQTFDVAGDVSAVFNVPEPSALALAGLALLGLGLASRRRKAPKA